jgi:predicted RNase H-like HicB family nuclease
MYVSRFTSHSAHIYIRPIAAQYTAIIQRDGPWWIGWIQEIAGVNSQGATREELLDNLHSALQEALQMEP